jgi:predicted nucleic acid-binding protein
MRVFVDPGALFSALVHNDPHHADAGPTLKALLIDGAQLWTTAYGLHDMVNLLQQRVGMHAAVEFDRTYRPFLSVLWVKEEEHRTAFSRLRRRWDRELTLAQASLLTAMEEAGVTGLFSYHAELAEEGVFLIRTPDEWRAYAVAQEAGR